MSFAAITRSSRQDGYVASVLPGWTKCVPYVLISAMLGARLSQWLVELEKGGRGRGETESDELFFYVVAGAGKLNAQPLEAGGFGYVPAGDGYEFVSTAKGTRVLVFRKNYEPLDGAEPPAFFVGHEKDVSETPFLGDPHARLKTLIPDTPGRHGSEHFYLRCRRDAALRRDARHGARDALPHWLGRLPTRRRLAPGAGRRRHLDRAVLPAVVHRRRTGAGTLHLLQGRESHAAMIGRRTKAQRHQEEDRQFPQGIRERFIRFVPLCLRARPSEP
jgi:hypothetical protein